MNNNPTGINQYTRRQGHSDLNKAINKGIKGVNASLTKAAYRSVAAKALVNNRKVFASVGMTGAKKTEMLYKTATLAVNLKKSAFAKFAKTLAPVHRNK